MHHHQTRLCVRVKVKKGLAPKHFPSQLSPSTPIPWGRRSKSISGWRPEASRPLTISVTQDSIRTPHLIVFPWKDLILLFLYLPKDGLEKEIRTMEAFLLVKGRRGVVLLKLKLAGAIFKEEQNFKTTLGWVFSHQLSSTFLLINELSKSSSGHLKDV